MQILSTLMIAGTLLLQALIIKEQIEINKWFRRCARERLKKREQEEKTTHMESPKWVEEFIDKYMANSEKDRCQ